MKPFDRLHQWRPGSSEDCDQDDLPDECELRSNDCNGNTVPDNCDSVRGVLKDQDGNGVADECEAKFLRGDANGDREHDVSDAVFILLALFGGRDMGECPDALDASDDGRLQISDAIGLLAFSFLGGLAPAEPIQVCGLDPTPDDLTCMAFNGCQGER